MSVSARLHALGIVLPTPPAPVANYVPWVRTGSLVAVSGQIPMRDGALMCCGPVCAVSVGTVTVGTVTVEQATEAARVCFINLLAQVAVACDGDLDRVRQVVRLGGYIAAPATFDGHAAIMNGASDLAVAVFGPAGRHARSTIGVPSLPGLATVEVDGWFEVA